MQIHPLLQSKSYKVFSLILFLLCLLVQWTLLVSYTGVDMLNAFVDSIVSIGILAIFCFFLWYAVAIRVPQVEFVLTLIVMALWLAGSFAGDFIAGKITHTKNLFFYDTIPFRFLFGLLLWIGILIWYRLRRLQHWRDERITTDNLKSMQTEGIVDRIALKDGTRIHIIQLNNLIYVQASGDYVNLVTTTGQYLKEQTMKSLEAQLPPTKFQRIHRSYIVNVECIKKVELYGKETYNVQLTNGDIIRASSSGYKQLKEQLLL